MRNELLETFSAAYVRVKLVEIADVIAVCALCVGFKDRREVTIGNAKLAQIACDLARLRKREVAIELKSISCAWNALAHREIILIGMMTGLC